MSNLKEKLKCFFDYIEIQKEPNVSDVINEFRTIFQNDYFTNSNITNTAYYQENSKCYYIKNSCGIVLSIFSGDGDRYGDNVSHKGVDITITSLLSKDSDCKYGISIFDESIYCHPSLLDKIESFFDYDLSIDNFKENDDKFLYKTLPDNLKNNSEITNYRYTQLKVKAELKNSSLYDDYMISPYGGLDIDVIPVDELLYEYLQEFKDDIHFFEKAMTLFNCDFPNYFSEKIKEYSHALYIIKHKNEYETLLDLEESIWQYEWNQSVDISELEKQKSDKQLRITELLEEKRILSNRKYNLFELIKGKKNFDIDRVSIIDKLIKNIKKELEDLEKAISEYNDGLEYYKDLKTDFKLLQNKLKKPFKNFSIKEDFMDIYINGKYGKLESLERLIYEKKIYTTELKNLLENQAKVKENFLNLKNNKEHEIEFQN